MDVLERIGGAAVGALLASLGWAQTGPQFAPPRILPAVFMVGADVATGDLNRDGVPDLTQCNTGFALGTNLLDFRAKLLDRDGAQLADVTGAVPAGPPSLSSTVRVATGDFDEDGWTDVVSISLNQTLGISCNGGQSTLFDGFTNSTMIDDLARFFTVPWPTIFFVPVFEAADFDADGHLDLLVVPMLAHYLGQSVSSPGMFVFYGNGDGTFAPVCHTTTPNTIIDADWVDWDGDGVAETLLTVGQISPNASTYSSWLQRYRFANRQTVQVGASQSTGTPMFVTSLAHARGGSLMGGQHAVFLTGHTNPNAWSMQASLAVVEMNPQGSVTAVNSITLPTTLATPTLAELVAAQTTDLDGDGEVELVCLMSQKNVAHGDVVVLQGPLDSLGTHAGFTQYSLGVCVDSRNNPPSNGPGFSLTWSPRVSNPRALAVVDLDLDQAPDLAVGGLSIYTPTNTQLVSATLRNLRPVAMQGRVESFGPARATPAGVSVRTGTTGGHPVAGNADFKITLGNGPRDALVATMAGCVPGNFVQHGLPFVFVPEQYGALQWLHGSNEGATAAHYDLPVPNTPWVLGMYAYFQWMVCDLNAAAVDPLPLYPSDAIAIEFGALR
jgi:hypothetical protein